MHRFVVLLRGVNVGRTNRVPMADFKAMLEELGHTQVRTLLNSGNAAFSSAERSTSQHASAIAAALEDRLGVATSAIVKSSAELTSIIGESPIVPAASDHSRFLVAFASDAKALHALAALQSVAKPPERVVITSDAAYLHCPAGLMESKLGKAILGKAGKNVTTRNWATVLKLGAMIG